ncbi:MAG: M23 family metallopeptidase [Gaiellaceae bacterium]
MRPFHRQHPVRAFFGDPRTVFRSADDADLGAFSFHNGIDIVAADGTPVYPVLSGTVIKVLPDEIVVASNAQQARTFQYWHLDALVRLHEHVRALRTVLGTVQPSRGHVHLAEIDGTVVENPLQPGHITPYRDETAPTVENLSFHDAQGRALNPQALAGSVALTVGAADPPPLPLPAPWAGVSVTPARLGWTLSTRSGTQVLPEQLVADFSVTIPPRNQFWSVYATGTYQNFPTVGQHYYYGTPGDYLFKLTPSLLDTRALAPGPYRVTVVAADTCGNRGTLTEQIRVLPQPGLPPLTRAILGRLPASGPHTRPRRPRRFWTVVLARLPRSDGLSPAPALLRRGREARLALELLRTAPAARRAASRHELVVTGRYATWAAAYTAAQRVAARFPGAYPREVVLARAARGVRKRRPRRRSLVHRPRGT